MNHPLGNSFSELRMEGDVIPVYSKNGRALSHEERAMIAKRRGVCLRCGVKTHKGAVLRRQSVTDDNVYQGTCIRCQPKQVPPKVREAWVQRNKSSAIAVPPPPPQTPQTPSRRGSRRASTSSHSSHLSSSSPSSSRPIHSSSNASIPLPQSVVATNRPQRSNVAPSPRMSSSSSRKQLQLPSRPKGSMDRSGHSVMSNMTTDSSDSVGGPTVSSPSEMEKGSNHSGLGGFLNRAARRRSTDMTRRGSSRSLLGRSSYHTVSTGVRRNKSFDESYHGNHRRPSNDSKARRRPSFDDSSYSATGRASNHTSSSTAGRRDGSGSGIGRSSSHSPTRARCRPSFDDTNPETGRTPKHSDLDRASYHGPSISTRRRPSSDAIRPESNAVVAASEQTSVGSSLPYASSDEDYTGGAMEAATPQELFDNIKAYQKDPAKLKQVLHHVRNSQEEDDFGPLLVFDLQDIMGSRRQDSRLMAIASGAVWRIGCGDDEKKEEIADSGVIDVLVDALRDHLEDPELSEWVIGALASLVYSAKCRALIVKAKGIQAVLEALEKNPTAGIVEWACRYLYNLIIIYDADQDESEAEAEAQRNIATIEESDGVSMIATSMRVHVSESSVQLWAMKLLVQLQVRSCEEMAIRIRKMIFDAETLPCALTVFRTRTASNDLFQQAAELVSLMLTGSGQETSSIYNAVSECVPDIVCRMAEASGDSALQESSCVLLTKLSNGIGITGKSLKDSQAVEGVIAAMEIFPSNLIIIQSGSWMLWKLSADASFFKAAVVERASKAMNVALQSHKNVDSLTLSVCGFVANACSVPEISLFDLPSLGGIVQVLEEPSADARKHAAHALANTCRMLPDAIDCIMESLGVFRIVEMIGGDSSSTTAEYLISILVSIISRSATERLALLSSGMLAAAAALLKGTTRDSMLVSLLELISVLVVAKKNRHVELPIDIIPTILGLLRSEESAPEIREMGCASIRNLLLASALPPVDVNGLADCMSTLIEDSSCSVEIRVQACGVLWALAAMYPVHQNTTLHKMFQSVVVMMKDFNGEKTPFRTDVNSVVAGALASISENIKQAPITIESLQVDAMISTIYRTVESGHKEIETLARLLDTLMNLCSVAADTMIQCGTIVVVIDAMVEYESNAQIQEKGCIILAMLSSPDNVQNNLNIVQTDGIDMLVSALASFGDNNLLQSEACKAFSHLSIDPNSRLLIISQGGIHLIVTAMTSHQDDEELLKNACSALCNLTSNAEEQVLAATGDSVIEVIVKSMSEFPLSATLQECGVGVLENVSMGGVAMKQSIVRAGGINAVISAIEQYLDTPSLLERAFTTLWTLAVLEETQIEIADAGAVDLVVNGMLASIDYEFVQTQGCRFLWAMSSNSENGNKIRNAGGADAIVFAMRAHFASETLQTEGNAAISRFSKNTPEKATEGEIDAILSAMRRFPRSESLQVDGRAALHNLMLSPDSAALVGRRQEEAKAVMNRAASNFPARCSEEADHVH